LSVDAVEPAIDHARKATALPRLLEPAARGGE
jgi:hypothetical protein